MPRIVGRRADGAVVVGVGGVCVVVEPETLDDQGHWTVGADAAEIRPVYVATGEPGVMSADDPMPRDMLTAAHIEAILHWEVGFVEGVPGDPARPGLGAEAELYLRYRPDTGDAYPKTVAPHTDPMFTRGPDDTPMLDLAELPASEAAKTAATGAHASDARVPEREFDDYDDPAPLHQFCASMAHVEDLSGEDLVAEAAQDLIDRVSYAPTVAEFYPALADAVAAADLPDDIVESTDGFGREEILDFLERVVAELDRRRPWPDPALLAVDPQDWPSIGASRPIGWVDMFIDELEWALKESFGDVPDDDLPMLVLRLRGGQLVALVGEDPDPERFLVLLPDLDGRREPREVIDYLARYAGLEVSTDGLDAILEEVPAP
ncbi:hypothetical protein ABIA39_001691 [Nocardia sp. GAS34]|uniref:hypothetical protein n=1 Tax=unclassified Nocardia TaxID=2637762 RepID=UPI003D1DD9D0